jgi:glucose/arabinose dehydrogenase
MNTLAGKICRVLPGDGSPAPGNPFTPTSGSPRSIYAMGFRNPFRFCFAPDGRLFVTDVGSNNAERREEVNLVYAGDNCGWPEVEGIPETIEFPQYTYPIVAYRNEGTSPVGVLYYTGNQFPAEYAGNVFHLDYVRNKLFRIVLSGDRALSHELFMQGEGGTLDLVQGPDGSLVYCEFASGTVKAVRYTAASGNEPTDPTVATTDDEPPPASPRFCGAGVAGATAASFLLMTSVAHPRRRLRAERLARRFSPSGPRLPLP